LNFRKISKFFSYLNRLFFGVWLPSSCDIGKNFSLGYWGIGIVIHNDSIIGNNVTISQNVTIGRNFGELFVPKIGNDVYIGAGTVIFGDITIGNNVIIGANSLINKSIPENSTVAGNPFFIIQENRILKYYELDQKKIIINK
jgi:serine O-acetyltransferase